MKDVTSIMFLGVGNLAIIAIFLESIETPPLEMMCPKYCTFLWNKLYLLKLACNFYSHKNYSTNIKLSSCSVSFEE